MAMHGLIYHKNLREELNHNMSSSTWSLALWAFSACWCASSNLDAGYHGIPAMHLYLCLNDYTITWL